MGGGLAMRAGAVLQALAKQYHVHLAVPFPDGTTPVRNYEERVSILPRAGITFDERVRRSVNAHFPALYRSLYSIPGDWAGVAAGARRSPAFAAASSISESPSNRVHVFRHSMAPFAAPFLGKTFCQLDLDESESRTRRSIAALARRNGDTQRAQILEDEAAFYAQSEREWLPRFDRIFVSSAVERELLLDREPHLTVDVLPNTVALPSAARNVRQYVGPPTLLFVGNLAYYPNDDAIRHFVLEILPRLKAQVPDVRLNVVGGGASRTLRKILRRDAAVDPLGFVADISSAYYDAHAAIVPLRAGGGTRIKILEAFAHRRPVVSTRAGCEGLGVRAEEHLLVADAAEDFANACLRLLHSETLRAELSARAYGLVADQYGSAALDILI
jgi:glycosyltransferase involved in cell wall biosynthesis